MPPGIFAHAPPPPDELMEGVAVVHETMDVAMVVPAGSPSFIRSKREAKGGGRLPNRNG